MLYNIYRPIWPVNIFITNDKTPLQRSKNVSSTQIIADEKHLGLVELFSKTLFI